MQKRILNASWPSRRKRTLKPFINILTVKKCNRESVGPLKVDSVLVEDDQEVANVLNQFFGGGPKLNISKIKDDILPLLTVPINSYLVKEKLGNLSPRRPQALMVLVHEY